MTQALAIGIVEDSDEDFAVFKRIAEPSGEISRWSCGEDALQDFRVGGALRQLSILFVDCHLPGIDGIDLVRQVRAMQDGSSLTIVMVSGSRSEGVSGRAIRAGVDRFERKGNSLSDLRNALKRSFELLAVSDAERLTSS